VVKGLSDRARGAVELAGREARGFGHAYVGPEHVLLGLLDGLGETAAGLRSAGIGASDVRTLVDCIVGVGAPIPIDHPVSLSDRAQRVVVRALAFARDGGCEEAGTDHLLLALLLERPSIAARVIEDLGVDAAELRDQLIADLAGDQPGLAERYRESIEAMLDPQAAAGGQLVDPFADELPDLVDGLLESDRQVLSALSNRYASSRRIVRGDPLLYARLVRMAQDWVTRYPLVEGHGNFGSIDGFEPANMEFTEARRAPVAADAALFPLLLVNGGPGIPPHNLAEVIAATVAHIEDASLASRQLLDHTKGPDFPTGGIVLGGDALSAFYETGRGSMTVRGRAELQPGRTGQQIVVTELPYGVMKGGDGGLIVQIVDGIRHGALEAIVDLYDDSSQEHGIRLVLVLAPETDADAVLDALHEHTDLQMSPEVHLTSLVEGRRDTLNLHDLIAECVSSRLAHQSRDSLRERLIAAAKRHTDSRRTTIA
jgi:hypothetical protein